MRNNIVIKDGNDKVVKYGMVIFPRLLHDYLRLPGRFIRPCPTHIITADMRDLDMDYLYLVCYEGKYLLINLEQQTEPVRDDKIVTLCEYRDYSKVRHGIPVLSVVISSKDPKKSIQEFALTSSDIIRPVYFSFSGEEVEKILNTLETKVDNNEELDYIESLHFAYLPLFVDKSSAGPLIEKLCTIFAKDTSIEGKFRMDLVFAINIMINKYIKDENKKRQLKELIKLDETIDEAILSFANNEDLGAKFKKKEEAFMKEIKDKDEIIMNMGNEIKDKDEAIMNMGNEIKDKNGTIMNMGNEIKDKDEAIMNMGNEIGELKEDYAEIEDAFKTLKKNNVVDDKMLKALNINIVF